MPKHGESYRSLSREEAAHIAYLSGEPESPASSRVCLGCHAASGEEGPRWTMPSFRIADGVQCETCHGAGSLHVDARRGDARRAESKLPPSPPHGAEPDRYGNMDRLRTEKASFCRSCHIERASHRQVLIEGYRRPGTDLLYKTPINLAVSPSGDRLYVVCENSNSVLVVDPLARRVVREIAVGRRPQDVALSPDGRTLYVTNRLSGTLSAIDLGTGSIRSEVRVGDEPHGVLTDRSGRRVFVLDTGQDQISVIDAASLAEVKRLAAGNAPWSLALAGEGDLLLVTNALPDSPKFEQPPQSEVTGIAPAEGRVVFRARVDGANMLEGIAGAGKSGVALFTLMRTKNLVPISRMAQGWVVTNGLGVVWPDGRVDQVLLDEPAEAFPDPTDIAVSPDGGSALVTSAGADEIAVIDIPRLLETVRPHGTASADERMPDRLGLSGAFVTKRIPVGHNPRGVSYLAGRPLRLRRRSAR